MKTLTRLIFAGCFFSLTHFASYGASSLQNVERTQARVGDGVNALADRIEPILAELIQLGASQSDVQQVHQALGELQQLSDQEIVAILAALREAASNPASADQTLSTALAGQERVLSSLRKILTELSERQQERELAARAERLRRRQAENRHQTELVREGRADAVAAAAEQDAIEEAVNELTREAEALAQTREETEPPVLDEEAAVAMQEQAGQASEQLDQQALDQAVAAQNRLEEMLADLAARAGQEPASAEFAASLVQRLEALRERQRALVGIVEITPAQAAAQERVAAEAETVRIPVENVNAPAGYQVALAVDRMRKAYVKWTETPPSLARAEQEQAVESLSRAIDLLRQSMEAMEPPENEPTHEEAMQELANQYHKAEELQKRQEQMNQQGGSASEQAAIARETAQLQGQVLEESPEAARDLGRAAARMAESMDANKTAEERAALREEAARQLGKATQAVLQEGRARRNQPPGQSGGGLSGMETVSLDPDVMGAATLSPGEREAIAAAKHEPVSPEYAPLVEAYFDKLSRQPDEAL